MKSGKLTSSLSHRSTRSTAWQIFKNALPIQAAISLETKKQGGNSYELPPCYSPELRGYLPPGRLYFAVQGIKPPSGFLSGVKTSYCMGSVAPSGVLGEVFNCCLAA